MSYPAPKWLSFRLATTAFAALLCTAAIGEDVTWTGADNDAWENGLNWDNNTGPANADFVFISSGTVNFSNASGSSPSMRGFRMSGGTLNISGGQLNVAQQASQYSDFDSQVNQTGGATFVNAMQIGSASGAIGTYELSGGELIITRGTNGHSFYLGGNRNNSVGGLGIFIVSGGSFRTRDDIRLGNATAAGTGVFTVSGSQSEAIDIGGAGNDIDGGWHQHAGSSLIVRFDVGGCTPIVIHDNTDATGTSATFENGALLNTGYVDGGGAGGGTWTVMEVENGDIIDNGLAFAPGVDTSVWSFEIDNSGPNGILTVTSNDPIARDVFWNGNTDNRWENPLNWTNNFGPYDGAYVHINSGIVDFSASSGTSPRLRGFRMTGGTLNISDNDLDAAENASAYSNLDGMVFHDSGSFLVNALEIGRTIGSNSSYCLSDGELRVGRSRNGHSLYLGSNSNFVDSGDGVLEISGGEFLTRIGVKLGDANRSGTGTFSVLGSSASIAIGGANNDGDGTWEQYAGSTLSVGVDVNGVSTIVLEDNFSASGTSVVFEAGSLLNVDYHADGAGGGTWTVLEVENADIVDNGLAFAPEVDTDIWSFSIDNSGSNGRLLVSAVGLPAGHNLIVSDTRLQRMRFGMDYERLWFWTGGLNAGERDDIAKWSAVDTRIDYIRVAINCGYELNEGDFNLNAYTNKIIPMMQEMVEANPDIKFFASPRPLEEAQNNVRWQPYPQWITGGNGSGSFNFNWQKAAEYLERYILLMKSYGFKISFLDVTNEWQNPGGSGRITTGDVRDISEYLKSNLLPEDMPLIIGPSAWNYSQGSNWINDLDTQRRRNAVDIAACHNTSRTGSAQQFADSVRNVLGPDTEIWNTEVHGWKSTSGENETTSFYFYLEKIRAGFSGLNGWLAIGTTNQGHAYILNPSGTPRRNVKYFIFKKLSATSNYGNALDIIQEPDQLSHTAALIKGNLMTVWVINQGTAAVPLNIFPEGRTISESTVKRTRWTDPADVEGFVTHEIVTDDSSLFSSIPGESVCCFEILLEPEDLSYAVTQAEDEDDRNGMFEEQSGDSDGTLNLGGITDNGWARYDNFDLSEDSTMRFRVARPANRPDGWIEVYLGSPAESTASILAGTPVGKVEVPETGNWQTYETIEACLELQAGNYDIVLDFVELGSTTGNGMFNLNWFSVESAATTLLGDVNSDGFVDLLDIAPFVDHILNGTFNSAADINQDGVVDLLDVTLFVQLILN